jgi:hypothetical protein
MHVGRGKMSIALNILFILSVSLPTFRTTGKVDFLSNQTSSPAKDYLPPESWLYTIDEEQEMNSALLPNITIANLNEQKPAITLEILLTISLGLTRLSAIYQIEEGV